MDESRLRREVRRLDSERKTLLLRVLRQGRMVKGSLYRLGRSCGNPNCKCAGGGKHFSWYLSLLPFVPCRLSRTRIKKSSPLSESQTVARQLCRVKNSSHL
jgi:hypothetical protein